MAAAPESASWPTVPAVVLVLEAEAAHAYL